MVKFAIGVMFALALGSSAGQQRYWAKDGATEKDFKADSAYCVFEARRIYQPQRDAVTERMNRPTESVGGVAIRRSPAEGAAALAQLANINELERQASTQCMYGRGWELK